MSTLRDVTEAVVMFYGACLMIGTVVFAFQTALITVALQGGSVPALRDAVVSIATYSLIVFGLLVAFGLIVYLTNFAGIRDQVDATRTG